MHNDKKQSCRWWSVHFKSTIIILHNDNHFKSTIIILHNEKKKSCRWWSVHFKSTIIILHNDKKKVVPLVKCPLHFLDYKVAYQLNPLFFIICHCSSILYTKIFLLSNFFLTGLCKVYTFWDSKYVLTDFTFSSDFLALYHLFQNIRFLYYNKCYLIFVHFELY